MSLIDYYSILKMLKNLKRSDNYVALSALSEYYTWKSIKESYKKIHLKYQLQHGMKVFIFQIDRILYQILKTILNIS